MTQRLSIFRIVLATSRVGARLVAGPSRQTALTARAEADANVHPCWPRAQWIPALRSSRCRAPLRPSSRAPRASPSCAPPAAPTLPRPAACPSPVRPVAAAPARTHSSPEDPTSGFLEDVTPGDKSLRLGARAQQGPPRASSRRCPRRGAARSYPRHPSSRKEKMPYAVHRAGRTITTSGKTPTTCAASFAARRSPNTGRRSRPGRPCSIST